MLIRVVAMVALFGACGSLRAQEEGLHWIDNYKEALRISKETGKPIFLEYRCEP
ncbi:MAG: hypothetical protein JNL98_33310 [Bryobacterales bacterium]|nr:hypothetical protein [Bryobacterales bacterium]